MPEYPHVLIKWAKDVNNERNTALTAQILESGWVRVHWAPGNITYVSPAAIQELAGVGVSFSDQ